MKLPYILAVIKKFLKQTLIFTYLNIHLITFGNIEMALFHFLQEHEVEAHENSKGTK